jgi:hypothetical protein
MLPRGILSHGVIEQKVLGRIRTKVDSIVPVFLYVVLVNDISCRTVKADARVFVCVNHIRIISLSWQSSSSIPSTALNSMKLKANTLPSEEESRSKPSLSFWNTLFAVKVFLFDPFWRWKPAEPCTVSLKWTLFLRQPEPRLKVSPRGV